MRATIALAGGNEVCFACQVGAGRRDHRRAPVARGDVSSVLALPGVAQRGEMLVHNHPSGVLEPSGPDLEIAARVHDDGIGFGIIDNAASALYVVVEVPREKARARARSGGDRRAARARRADRRAARRATRTARASARWPSASRGCTRRRHRADRGRHRRRQVARLSRAGAALGRGERRAHGRLDQHDQPAGAARRQGPAVPAGALARPARALRAAQGMAELSLPPAARAGARRRAHAVRRRRRARARGARRVGASARPTARPRDLPAPPRPTCGTRSPPRRTSARGSAARTSTGASCSRRAGSRRRPTSWW